MLETIVQTVGTVLGAGVMVALINGWNRRQATKAKDAVRDRQDAVGILREALTEERRDHSDCQQRVTVLEASAFREREARETERAEARAAEAACQRETARLRGLVLETYVKSTPVSQRDPELVARLSSGPVDSGPSPG